MGGCFGSGFAALVDTPAVIPEANICGGFENTCAVAEANKGNESLHSVLLHARTLQLATAECVLAKLTCRRGSFVDVVRWLKK